MSDRIDERLDALAKQPFRARLHLRGRGRALVQLRGTQAILFVDFHERALASGPCRRLRSDP